MKARIAMPMVALLLTGCGQTGKLYLPEKNTGEVVTRPTQTPPATPSQTTPAVPDPDAAKKDKKDGAATPAPPK